MHRPALSTMWMQLRHERLGDFVRDARALGFDEVELSPVVTEAQLHELLPDDLPAVRVLHHPCPADGGLPELSDPDDARRRRAVEGARNTLAWAGRLDARAVVLHLGEVALDRRWENALRARWLQDDAEGTASLRDQLWLMRAALAPAALDAARRSLAVILPEAARAGIALGVETGEWLSSLPSLDESAALLDDFGAPLGLWVDTGHTTIQERLGGPTLEAWLRLAPARLVGLHYHDVRGLRDHLIPGRGTIAWEPLAPLVPAHALPTCELDWYYAPDEIAEGAARLARAGLVAPLGA